MHSFAVTERYAVLSEWPHRVDPLDMLLEGKPFIENYTWQPERGTHFRVVRLSDGEEVAHLQAPAAFAFHHVNAFERGGEVVCDVVTYDDSSIIDALYLDRLRSDEPTPAVGTLQRYRLPLSGSPRPVAPETLADTRLELPRVHDEQVEGRPYRFVYGIGAEDPGDFTDQFVKIDVETGTAQTWREDGTYPGEPVFVPAPDATGEDTGVVLSVVLDPARDRSFLLLLDASSFTEIARAYVPHAIPFGFHGQFLGDG
jgi:carotenoid cleavage dioxygenase-like enzyme